MPSLEPTGPGPDPFTIGPSQVGASVVEMIDAYFDAVPRPDADAIEVGPFTLFVSRTPWAYYARPALGHPGAIGEADIGRLDEACRHYGVELAIEWVGHVHPELAEVAARSRLLVSTYVLMTMGPQATLLPLGGHRTAGVELRVAGAGDPALLDARAAANVAFDFGSGHPSSGHPSSGHPSSGHPSSGHPSSGHPSSGHPSSGHPSSGDLAPGRCPGPAERGEAVARLGLEMIEHLGARARSGLTITAVAESPTEGVLATGSYQPMGGVAEIVGVATLPAARRQGLAGAVTAVLASHARQHGVHTLILSAQNDDVARVYERVGFARLGTTHAAERPRY